MKSALSLSALLAFLILVPAATAQLPPIDPQMLNLPPIAGEREALVNIWNAGLPALDGPCLYCEGRGCLDCGDSGRLPTKVGLQILSFLDRSGWWEPDEVEEPEPVGVGHSSGNGSGELT